MLSELSAFVPKEKKQAPRSLSMAINNASRGHPNVKLQLRRMRKWPLSRCRIALSLIYFLPILMGHWQYSMNFFLFEITSLKHKQIAEQITHK